MRALELAGLVLFAIAGALIADRVLDGELEHVRGMRVLDQARAALDEGLRPDGQLTIVRENESARYPFLNKKSYLVHTSSSARAGTPLRASVIEDQGRSIRHTEARRKKEILTRLEGGGWRATVAKGTLSAELDADPAKPARPAPWTAAGLSFIAALLVLVVLHAMSRPPWVATAGALIAAAIAVDAVAEAGLARASSLATEYLNAASSSRALVELPHAGTRALIALWLGLALLIVLAASSGLGSAFARAWRRHQTAYLALLPALLGLGVLVGIPFLFGIGLSFFHHQHGTFTFVGLDNFAAIFSPPDRPVFAPGSLLYALCVNVVWTVTNVSLHLGIGLCLALILQSKAAGYTRFYRVILILPWAVPAYLTALIWKSMFDPDVGAVNRLLGLEGVSWMHNTLTAFLANLMTNVWLGFPFMMIVCLGALTSIPKDLYEAADVDGASDTQQFFRITLPLLKPALLPAAILGSIWTFNRFEIIYLVSEGRPDGATDILVTEAYRWAFERGLAQGGAYGYAAAYSVVIFSVLLVYGWMTSRVAKAAEEALR